MACLKVRPLPILRVIGVTRGLILEVWPRSLKTLPMPNSLYETRMLRIMHSVFSMSLVQEAGQLYTHSFALLSFRKSLHDLLHLAAFLL